MTWFLVFSSAAHLHKAQNQGGDSYRVNGTSCMISVHISLAKRDPSGGHGLLFTQLTTSRNDRGVKTFAHNVEYICVPLSFFHSCHAVACAC